MERIASLLKKHPDIDVCMNRNGIKLGYKGTDQIAWKRFGWQQFSMQKLTLEIEKLKNKPAKESPRLDLDDDDESESDSRSFSSDSSSSLDDESPRRHRPRRKSLSFVEDEPMTVQEIFSVPDWALEDEKSLSSGANIQQSLRKLGSRSLKGVKDFVRYAKKEGYLGKTPTAADVGVLVDTWRQNKKKQEQEAQVGANKN